MRARPGVVPEQMTARDDSKFLAADHFIRSLAMARIAAIVSQCHVQTTLDQTIDDLVARAEGRQTASLGRRRTTASTSVGCIPSAGSNNAEPNNSSKSRTSLLAQG